jgi:predicted amino acid-binding ACT domain protein
MSLSAKRVRLVVYESVFKLIFNLDVLVAIAALRRKRVSQATMDRLAETRLQLEVQVNILESAYLNAEATKAMKKASDALKVIHRNL